MEALSTQNIIILLSAYLIGSVPTSLWVGKYFHNVDIRKHGSGNAGATNTIRVLGPKSGFPVLIIDILKGFLAASLVYLFNPLPQSRYDIWQFQFLLGLLAIFGHIFPIFANFRGGKGIATLFGVLIAIHPWSALICMFIFLIVFILSRIVSISSMIAVISFPVITFSIFKIHYLFFIGFTIFFAFITILTHRSNIRRLLQGREKKLSFSEKNK